VAHVFVDDAVAGQVRVGDEDFHHLAHVLRLRSGELVSASDGAGNTVACRWTGSAVLEPVGEPIYEQRPAPELTVAFSLTKGAHPDWAVQKLTEAGVDHVIVMTAARSVARWDKPGSARRLGRLREVARQAAMQSRRAWLPTVAGPFAFSEVVVCQGTAGCHAGCLGGCAGGGGAGEGAGEGAEGRAGCGGLALAVPGGAPLTPAASAVLIGPEGGWEDAELAAVPSHVSLGPYILRAETAAMAAGVLLVALRAGLLSGSAP
jgi:16S rRNA (uracil1498-N3)-methyltransferase